MSCLEKLENFDKWLAEYNSEDVYSLAEKLNQRIAELEAKVKQVAEEFNKQHELLDQYELDCTDEIVRLKNQKIEELEEENAKLQEQLKNAYCPKYKIGERKWFVEPNPYCNNELQVFNGEIYDICVDATNDDERLLYKLDTGYDLFSENELFATEAEAQKYLDGRK